MQRQIKTINADECYKLIEYFDRITYTYNDGLRKPRNLLICLLLLDAGLRVAELVQLQIGDLWGNGLPLTSLVVRPEISKSKRERVIPLSERICKAIEEMMLNVWHFSGLLPTIPAFFSGNDCRQLTTRQIQRIIGRACIAAFGRHIHPHALRHTFATRLMKNSNIRVVQLLLGHRRLTSTQIYTHPDAEDLKTAIESISR